MITVADLIAFRLRTETLVRRVAEADVRTRFGEFRVHIFENTLDGEHHLALAKGVIEGESPVLVRVQSQSTLGDVFDAAGHEGGGSLRAALRRIEDEGRGILVYLRKEGRGAGLAADIRAQAEGCREGTAPAADTQADIRLHGIGAQILRGLGARKIAVLTDHPRRLSGLHGFGLVVVGQVPLITAPVGHPSTGRSGSR
jgi:3,4-dihydroxy 2-butanone 4-phosphate synthase/GTP cyclohydrolase II